MVSAAESIRKSRKAYDARVSKEAYEVASTALTGGRFLNEHPSILTPLLHQDPEDGFWSVLMRYDASREQYLGRVVDEAYLAWLNANNRKFDPPEITAPEGEIRAYNRIGQRVHEDGATGPTPTTAEKERRVVEAKDSVESWGNWS